MTHAITHRGPDDTGESYVSFGERTVGLGHRRLSIIDLSPLGHQPMIQPDSGDAIIFNGEIYNFRRLRRDLEVSGVSFRSQSDTEVLLHGLAREGAAFLDRLEGMYALAYLDRAGARVLLARDPVGIKPLYTALTDRGLLFASELRAILASGWLPRRIDSRAAAGYLAYGAVQAPLTIIDGVRSFPPGGHAWIDLRSPLRDPFDLFHRTWHYPRPQPFSGDAVPSCGTRWMRRFGTT